MVKEFIIQCILFQSKDPFHKFLGVYAWFNLLLATNAICSIISIII